jgi:hypothetical protein
MPVYNEAAQLPETIDALVSAVERSGFAMPRAPIVVSRQT